MLITAYCPGKRPPGLTKTLLVMKLMAVILFCTCITAKAGGLPGNITYTGKNVSIEKIFTIVKKQTGYAFVYQEAQLRKFKPVTVDAQNLSLESFLQLVFKEQPLNYLIEKLTVTVTEKKTVNNLSESNGVLAFYELIKGRITDSTGQALEGVTVSIKGTRKITTTNAAGEFSIDVPSTGVLVISYTGFETREIKITTGDYKNIQLLPRNKNLEEVVVVGYGTQRKANLTGAVDQVGGEVLQQRPITNVSEGLQGIFANVNISATNSGGAPGAGKSINLRGFTGLNAASSPLILVDGVPADINTINPTDIASITVLKDAASSAIYGSRAPNGVILITTNQGAKSRPLRINYNVNLSSSQPVNLPRMMNSLDWANLYNESALNAQQGKFIPESVIDRIKAYLNDPVNTPATIADPNGRDWGTYDNTFGNANNDWFKVYMKKNAASQQHSLSLDGGSEKIAYFLGLGYTDKTGMFKYFEDSYNRYNFRSNITAEVNKWVSIGLKAAYTQENFNYPNNGGGTTGGNWFHQIGRIWPIIPITAPNGGMIGNSNIPLIKEGGRVGQKSNDSWMTGEVNIKPLPGWIITGSYSYNYFNTGYSETTLPYYSSTQQDPRTLSNTISSVYKSQTQGTYQTYNLFTSYEKKLSDHYFKVMVGQQQEVKRQESLNGFNQSLYNINQPSLSLTYGTNVSAGDGGYAWATNGTFGRINYSFQDKYILEFNGRYMGSSFFPKDTRNHFFKAFSAGWVVSNESFWSSLAGTVQNLKLRGSYGTLGDLSALLDNQNYYPYVSNLRTFSPQNTSWLFDASGTRQPAVSPPSGLVSPTLTWAKPAMLDLGVDIRFLKDFNLTFDWYKRKVTDLFGTAATYPVTLGVNPPTPNNATVETKGFDASLTWNRKFGKVGINVRATLADYKGKVVSFNGNASGSLDNSTWYNGKVMGEIWGFKTEGLFQSPEEIAAAPSQTPIGSVNWFPGDVRYKELNKDGKISWGNYTLSDHGDLVVIGNSTPRYSYGFSTGVDWKGFDLNIFLQGVAKRDFWAGGNYYWGITNAYQSTALTTLYDRWTPTNTGGYFPKLYLNGDSKNQNPSDRYLINAAYLRLKNVQLGYTLPEKILKKAHITRCRFYISGENLLTMSPALKHQFVDPELLRSDSKIYPLQRSFSAGLNISFQ